MKKLLLSGLLSVLFLSAGIAQWDAGQTGYEGDNFSLEGAIELFQHSNSIEDFERRLNTEDTWVNNLDLNYDGRIDYIRVEHLRQGNFHAIVLQAIISRYEIQDVAVIEIEKISRYDAILQIVGDADLYGEEVIVESQRNRDNYASSVSYRGYDNVYYWEPVQYIFAPRYVVYVSPYRWSYYPTWWSPWRQCAWNVYYPRVVTYHNYYHVVNVHRVVNVHNYYYPSRTYCDRVSYRATQVRRQHGHSNAYRSTYKKNNTSYAKAVGNSSSTSVRRPDSRQASPSSQGVRKPSTTSVRKPSSQGKGVSSTSVRRPDSRQASPSSQGVRKPSTTSVRKPSSQGVRKPSTTSVRKPSSQGKGVSSTSVRKPSSQGTVKKPRNRSQSGHRATNMGSSTSRSRTSAVSKKPTNRSNQVRSQRSSSSSARSSAPSRSSRSVKPAPSRQRSSASSQRPSQKATPSRSSASRKSSAASSAPRKQYTAPKKSTPRASSSSKRSSTSRSVKPAAKPRAKSSSSAPRKASPSKRGGRG